MRKRASARHITAVIPILMGNKIEKTSQGSDRAKLVANLLDAASNTSNDNGFACRIKIL
jgi:phosphoribosylpyrophosphate synthetase